MTRGNGGFTYIGILIAVAIMGVLLAQVAVFWHKVEQRENERELLRIGGEFRRAIGDYYENSPERKAFPKKLDDLLRDGRYPVVKRYLRRIYNDPMTKSPVWGLVKGPGDVITGVYSLSEEAPVRQANFAGDAFSGKKHYSEWQFVYASNAPAAPTAAPAAAAPAPPPAPEPAPPPAYVPPPVAPPPSGNNRQDRKKFLCDMMNANDIRTCGVMLQKFGDAAGQYCLTSAAARYGECQSGAPMETLVVTY
ncbi:MAG: type II secretion system GspH family protein [Burkholderiales bacterium]|nr:type II secretion system GspH family protein [Burkholderiales bacterium]